MSRSAIRTKKEERGRKQDSAARGKKGTMTDLADPKLSPGVRMAPSELYESVAKK